MCLPVAHLMTVDEKDTMTKKPQPARSLRSLLFSGPQLEFTLDLPMEECIRRLQHLEKVGRLGKYPLHSLEINDFGRAVRWTFTTEIPVDTGEVRSIPLKGNFTLRGQQYVYVSCLVGSGVRAITRLILLAGSMMLLGSLLSLAMRATELYLLPLEWPWTSLFAVAWILIFSFLLLGVPMILSAIINRFPEHTNPAHIEFIVFYLRRGLVYGPFSPGPEVSETSQP